METMILQNYSEQLKKKIFISIPPAKEEGMNMYNSIEITLYIYCHVLSEPWRSKKLVGDFS